MHAHTFHYVTGAFRDKAKAAHCATACGGDKKASR